MEKQAEVGVQVPELIQKVGIREMQFPDTWVIIPCLVRLKNRHCVLGTRGY